MNGGGGNGNWNGGGGGALPNSMLWQQIAALGGGSIESRYREAMKGRAKFIGTEWLRWFAGYVKNEPSLPGITQEQRCKELLRMTDSDYVPLMEGAIESCTSAVRDGSDGRGFWDCFNAKMAELCGGVPDDPFDTIHAFAGLPQVDITDVLVM